VKDEKAWTSSAQQFELPLQAVVPKRSQIKQARQSLPRGRLPFDKSEISSRF
jgi:hypothetical protein